MAQAEEITASYAVQQNKRLGLDPLHLEDRAKVDCEKTT